ncbi:hypothetical protein EYF80_059494 [Liparis tanakae]|uniref:Uncharacterized protein n=1 Tax=Liparis tanakae TaxID=230148 RepID=A0A4Z2ENI9_9TELE|nr:hypothetical protein EYF80_059494 [Liparis tanakae]
MHRGVPRVSRDAPLTQGAFRHLRQTVQFFDVNPAPGGDGAARRQKTKQEGNFGKTQRDSKSSKESTERDGRRLAPRPKPRAPAEASRPGRSLAPRPTPRAPAEASRPGRSLAPRPVFRERCRG